MSHTRFLLCTLPLAALLALPACTGGTAPSTTDTAAAPAAPAISAGAAAVAAAKSAAKDDRVAATIGNAKITYAELDQRAASKLVRLKTQEYDIRKQTLDELIDEQLLNDEAKKRGITREELETAEIASKATEPTDEEAKAYFDANPPRGGVEFEKVMGRVKAFMKRKAEGDARLALITRLRADAGVEVMLEPLRFDVSMDDDPTYGPKDAPITIVEFSDFQCPYCSRVNPALEQVKETYGDKISLTFRDFPLPMHPEAPKAGEASHCADEQGKFWEYHDKLFENQRALKDENLKAYAAELALDGDAFAKCLDSGKYADDIVKDKADGEMAGVSGTPAFFINGVFLNGARPFENFKEVIDAELKAKGLL
jgi:protein-disulfide isomerase